MNDVLIAGYYGFSNSGDEALLASIISLLKKEKPDIKLSVLSHNAEKTEKLYGVRSVSRYKFSKIKKEIKNSRLLIFGGGSLIQDVTSSKSLYYYLRLLWLAQKYGKKTMLYANGIGPIEKPFNRYISSKILDGVDVITLRDDNSDVELKNIMVTRPAIHITADPVFALENNADSEKSKEILSLNGIDFQKKYAVISVRPWKKSVIDFKQCLAKFCDMLNTDYGITPIILPMQPAYDISISKEIACLMKTTGYVLENVSTVNDIFSLISQSEFVIGMRLHTLIYASSLGIPSIALSYDPKVEMFMKSVKQDLCLNVEYLNINDLNNMLKIMISSYDKRQKSIISNNISIREKALENVKYVLDLIK